MPHFKNVEYTVQLPGGWTKRFSQRSRGITIGSWDVYLKSPDGKRIRSNVQLMKMAIEQRMPLDPAFINVDRVLPTDPNFKNSKSLGKMITELRKEGLYAPDTTTDPSLLPMDEGLKYVKMNGLKQPLIGLAPVQQEEKLIVNQLAGLQPHPMAPMPFSRKQVRYLNKQLDKVEWPPTREQTDFIANQLKVEPIQVEAWFLEKQRKVACSLKALDHQTMDPSEFCDVIIVEGTDEIETETARTEPEVIGID